MTVRDWAAGKLTEEFGYTTRSIDMSALVVSRDEFPTAYAYFPEPNNSSRFGIDEFCRARESFPEVQFFTLIRQVAENSVYAMADELGVAVGGFNSLKSALATESDISRYKTSEQRYVQSRLNQNRHVAHFARCGESAYKITRKGHLSAINIVTLTHYEITSDEVYKILERYSNIDLHAIVVTNPACHGFAPEALEAAADTETRIMTLRDFLPSLEHSWT